MWLVCKINGKKINKKHVTTVKIRNQIFLISNESLDLRRQMNFSPSSPHKEEGEELTYATNTKEQSKRMS